MFASSSDLLFGSHAGRLQAETPLSSLSRFAEPPLASVFCMLRTAVTDNLALAYPQAIQGHFNIGMLHTALAGRQGHADYAPCSLEDLKSRQYDYWALGHVHEFEVVCTEPHVVFPGNTQGRTIRETGPKGAVIVTVEDGQVTTGAVEKGRVIRSRS